MDGNGTIAELKARATRLREHVVTVAAAQPAHLGGSMSCADIMAALFFHALRLDGDELDGDGTRDHFLLSKGHAVHVLHACLVERGDLDESELAGTCTLGSRLAGHPSLKTPGIELATGSLGHALSVGVGTALGEQLVHSDARTVVLLGDGELQEGTVWEAALCAPRFGLENLVAIVDYNRFQASGSVDEILPLDPLGDKWRSFRWNVVEIDGHDMGQILDALAGVPAVRGPTAIIANTTKGKGVPGIEGTPRAHYIKLSEEEAVAARSALGSAP